MALLDEEENRAAFGIYPNAFRGDYGNPQDAANLPLDVLRGRLAGLLGIFGDVVNQPIAFTPARVAQLAMQGLSGQEQYKYPDTERFLKTLPLAPTSRAGEVAGQAGSFVPLNPAPAVRAVGAGAKALAPTAARMTEGYLQQQGLMPNIIPVETARGLGTKLNLPSSPEFLQAVQNTPNAQITNEGLLMRLTRGQKPEQAGEISGRTGVFYLPEGSSSMSYYKHKQSAQNQTYGGSELFSGETLYKNPLFIKGATGGKAPQNAYDQLLGKGAYEKMRSDVLQAGAVRSIPSNRLSEAEKIDRIKETLGQYGGDPSMAENIYKNSPAGNQLAYAMQEHIVANAVRNAGYDSVLGYSKKKTGDPFLSEVFDLREKTYPSKVTESQIMNQFLPMSQQSGLLGIVAP
jgi:hypothetical protein